MKIVLLEIKIYLQIYQLDFTDIYLGTQTNIVLSMHKAVKLLVPEFRVDLPMLILDIDSKNSADTVAVLQLIGPYTLSIVL